MNEGSLECMVCGATIDVPEGIEVIRCLICGAPKSQLTRSSAVNYSDSDEAVMRGKGGKAMKADLASGERDQKEDRMARKTKVEEIDELVDDLDELEDDDLEVEDVDEVEEDDEDPDEAPKKKGRTRKAKAKPEKTGIGTSEVAEAAGIESRQLRMFLRAKGYQPRDEREGRYNWASLNDPEVKQILSEIRKGEAEKINKEKLAALKEKKAATKTTAKKTTRRKAAS